jgi:hypothetical protein
MLEYPFKIQDASKMGQNTTFALELLAAACSDDAHGTDYFDNLLAQHLLKEKARA